MRPFLVTLALLVWHCDASFASETLTRLGRISFSYDASVWSATRTEDAIVFAPSSVAPDAENRGDVQVRHLQSGDCSALATAVFDASRYDLDTRNTRSLSVSGEDGIRVEARTRCRNATPLGIVVCLPLADGPLLISGLQTSCRGRNPFPQIDPVDEIVRGIRIEHAAPQ